ALEHVAAGRVDAHDDVAIADRTERRRDALCRDAAACPAILADDVEDGDGGVGVGTGRSGKRVLCPFRQHVARRIPLVVLWASHCGRLGKAAQAHQRFSRSWNRYPPSVTPPMKMPKSKAGLMAASPTTAMTISVEDSFNVFRRVICLFLVVTGRRFR